MGRKGAQKKVEARKYKLQGYLIIKILIRTSILQKPSFKKTLMVNKLIKIKNDF
jgi:hypothetical protein